MNGSGDDALEPEIERVSEDREGDNHKSKKHHKRRHHEHGDDKKHRHKHHHKGKHKKHAAEGHDEGEEENKESESEGDRDQDQDQDQDRNRDRDREAEGEEDDDSAANAEVNAELAAEAEAEEDGGAGPMDAKQRRKMKSNKKKEMEERNRMLIDEQVNKLMDDMDQAAKKDQENKAAGKITFEKLKLLPKIKAELKKNHYHEPFLSKAGCNILALWIQRYPDGTLPCLDVLDGVLDIVDNLPITKKYLHETKDLGTGVMSLYKTNESVQLRMKAKRLIDKWCRTLFGIDLDYQNLSDKEQNYMQFQKYINSITKKAAPASPAGPREASGKMLDFEEVKAASPRQPSTLGLVTERQMNVRMGFDYIQRPVSEIFTEHKKEESSMTGIMRKIIQVKRDGRKKPSAISKLKQSL